MLALDCPSWYRTAPCIGNDELFFSSHPSHRREAKSICMSQCPNVEDCKQYAIDNNITIGVWGGMTGPELSRVVS